MLIGLQSPIYGTTVIAPPSYPLTSAAFLAATGITLTSYYPCQDASGSLVDTANANNLSAVVSPLYKRINRGHLGIDADTAGDGFAAAVNPIGVNSAIMGAVVTFKASSGPAVTPYVIGLSSDTTFPSFLIYRANDNLKYVNLLLNDTAAGSLLLGDVASDIVTANRPYLVMAQIDKNANLGRLVIADSRRILVNTSGDITGFITLTGGSNPKFNISGAGTATASAAVSLGFFATGVQCQGTTKLVDIAYRLGWGR